MNARTEQLSGHRFFASSDLDEAHAQVARIFCEHRLDGTGGLPRGPTIVNHAPLATTSINWFDYGRAVGIAPVAFERFYLLQIVRAGGARVWDARDDATVRAGEATIIAPSEQVRMDWSADCAKLIVRIDRAALDRFAEQWIGDLLPGRLLFERRVDFSGSTAATLRRTIALIVGDLEDGQPMLANGWAARRFEEALFTALLLGQPNSLDRALHHKQSRAVPRTVKLAEAYMLANAAQPITIADLVAVSGTSARTLFENYKQFRGVTPMQYLRRHRLAQARAELLLGEGDASVTAVAVRWGFEQLGRFASYYRSIYGEKPSETLRRAR